MEAMNIEFKRKTKNRKRVDPHLINIGVMFLACSILYYLPVLIGVFGAESTKNSFNILHNFYGIDCYALIFFIPVVYAAYSFGVITAVVTAFCTMIIFTPYSLFITKQPEALLNPTGFVLILSAVGAVVAMLQRNDAQRRQSLNELKCLYDIGKATENSSSAEQFISSVVLVISQDLDQKDEVNVSITLRNKKYFAFEADPKRKYFQEDIFVGGELVGILELDYRPIYSGDKKSNHFNKTLAERIGGAIHSIELEQSLKVYYEQLEEMVEARTRELEKTQDKLIRTERLAAVGELASGVGHELRNPLNVIRNCVYLLNMQMDGKITSDIEDTLKLLDLQVDISNKIVSDLLDFTRVKAPARSIVDLNTMIKDRISWANIPEKIKVIYNLSHESPNINIDSEQVGRAITNIINNAVQSISHNGELRISTGISEKYGWVTFADTGCGISQENLKKIFEPLFTTKPKGIGLGLAISKRMVEQNSGEIEVESTVGIGTTFTLKLPLIKMEVREYERACQHSGS
jgi:signal transduction histidine kinase